MKKSEVKLDEIDIGILRILQKNGRASYAELARKLGIPETTARFRVKKLLNKGVITRFVALLNPRKVGYNITMIMLVNVEPKFLDKVFKEISEMNELHHVFQMTGKYDLVIIFHAKDMKHANQINNSVRSLPGIRSAETLITTGLVKIRTELTI